MVSYATYFRSVIVNYMVNFQLKTISSPCVKQQFAILPQYQNIIIILIENRPVQATMMPSMHTNVKRSETGIRTLAFFVCLFVS